MSEVTIRIADKPTLDNVKAKVDDIYNMLEYDNDVYGFIEHQNILNPAQRIEYIGKNKNYTPLTIGSNGSASFGSWGSFPILEANKPWMVKNTGEADYQLSETDYSKKVDGTTASDVANVNYTGGAFSWLKKIYRCKYTIGDDVYTLFSLTKKNDSFKPDGFIDFNDKELEGVWLPMFYGTEITQNSTVKIMSLATGYPSKIRDTDTQKTYLTNFSSRAVFLGGPIVDMVSDLLTMFAKNNDIQEAYGYGNMSGHNASDTTNYGMKENAAIGGGKFYGTKTGTDLNKVLHSLVLLTQNQWQRDPYTMLFNGSLKVSKNYKYDLTGANLKDTGIHYDITGGWYYPHRNKLVDEFGLVPDSPCNGSTSLGNAAGFYLNNAITSVGLRFANCGNGRGGGLRCLSLADVAGGTSWYIGASPLLLPPEGYTP